MTSMHTPDDQGSAEPKRRKPRDKPLFIVITGHGKGTSTSAFGMLMRSWARGYQCGVFPPVGRVLSASAARSTLLVGASWTTALSPRNVTSATLSRR